MICSLWMFRVGFFLFLVFVKGNGLLFFVLSVCIMIFCLGKVVSIVWYVVVCLLIEGVFV